MSAKSKEINQNWTLSEPQNLEYTVKMNMLYLINKIVATDYKQYYLLN